MSESPLTKTTIAVALIHSGQFPDLRRLCDEQPQSKEGADALAARRRTTDAIHEVVSDPPRPVRQRRLIAG